MNKLSKYNKKSKRLKIKLKKQIKNTEKLHNKININSIIYGD